ncbi:malonic semialdehyde reductase [Ideonella sp. A 288]|uniref:malonic semialdehyde reductase n=1 Tax=Ideonella sp. A 288 TaxID=1962181 RepID=UPI000B4A5703|nr:malonic semialdehyde reductase [Ideonella sp. A 288]
MPLALDRSSLERTFLDAHTTHTFTDQPVDEATLRALVDLCRWGPTSMNCQPMRLVFVASAEAKARLKPALSAGNVDKTMKAPVTAIVAMDTRFHEHLPTQFPAMATAREMFSGNPTLSADTAMRNSSLQGAYLIVAARMLGLAAGPMSGFNADALNEAFFPDGRFKVNFLVNLGLAAPGGHHPRGPRLSFDEVASIV